MKKKCQTVSCGKLGMDASPYYFYCYPGFQNLLLFLGHVCLCFIRHKERFESQIYIIIFSSQSLILIFYFCCKNTCNKMSEITECVVWLVLLSSEVLSVIFLCFFPLASLSQFVKNLFL